MQVRQDFGSSGKLICSLTSTLDSDGTGLNLLGPNSTKPLTSGSIGVIISAVSSSNFDFGEALYDLEIASGSGDCAVVTRLLEGVVKLSKNITLGSF